MVRIEFSDCTYSIVRCIANEDTDEEEIIELPLLAYSDVFINDKYYSIAFDDGEIEEDEEIIELGGHVVFGPVLYKNSWKYYLFLVNLILKSL